jgi:uncharacterized protein
MGQPVVHFEVIGKDGGDTNADGIGIDGGVGVGPEGYDGHVTFYVEVPDVEEEARQAESLT